MFEFNASGRARAGAEPTRYHCMHPAHVAIPRVMA
jgi:hypothetical protein